MVEAQPTESLAYRCSSNGMQGEGKQIEAVFDVRPPQVALGELLGLEPPLAPEMIGALRGYLRMSWGQLATALGYRSRQYPWGVARGQFPITPAFEGRFWALVDSNPLPNTFHARRFDRVVPERRCLGRRMVCRECLAQLMDERGDSVLLRAGQLREHCLWMAGRQQHYCSPQHRSRFYRRPKAARERIVALAGELEAVL